MSLRSVSSATVPTSPDELIQGVRSLSEQIRSFRNGGLHMGSRELKDHHFDEDDSKDFDPSSEFGLDRFEQVEAISNQISSRMSAKKKQKLQHAETV